MISRSRLRRSVRSSLAVLGAAVTISAFAACSGDPDTDDAATAEPSATTTAEPDSTGSSDADEAAILAVYEQYWGVYVAAINGPNPASAPFVGIATDELIAQDTATALGYVEQGIVFTGEPVVSDTRVEIVEEDRAQVTSCVDDSDWVGTLEGEPLPKPAGRPEIYPVVNQVVRQDDTWLVGPTVEAGEDVQC
ncbi:MAG TPA: hypothetical protein VIP77_02500 [Jiangellaceae bacterium]